MYRVLSLTGILLIVAGVVVAGVSNGGSPQDASQPPAVDITPRTGQPRQKSVDELMQQKLETFELILEGLLRHDFESTSKAAADLKVLSLNIPKGWEKTEGDREIYQHFRMEFMRQAARLEEEATAERLAGAAYFQQQMTATCIACHDYIRDGKNQE